MDYDNFLGEWTKYKNWEERGVEKVIDFSAATRDDRVNSPSHYTSGGQEVIDTIEDAIKDTPDPVYGMLQAQVLKYMMRLWLKDNPVEDAKKAQWYLSRLIDKME